MLQSFFNELEKIALAAMPQQPPPQKSGALKKIVGGALAIGGIAAGGALLNRSARGLRAARKFGVTTAEQIPRSQSGIVNWWRGV